MKFFVFFFYLLCLLKHTISASLIQKARDIYDVVMKDDKTRSDEYIKSDIKTEKMQKIMKAFFQYKSGFHIVPTLVVFEKSNDIQNLKKKFKDCLKGSLQCSNKGNINVATVLVENFFLKIFNLEKVNVPVIQAHEKYEKDLSEFIDIISVLVSKALATILDKMSKLRNNNILTGKIVLENYTPLKEDYEKTKKQLLEFSSQKNQKKIIHYLKNDFEFFKQILTSCLKYGEKIFTDADEKRSYEAMTIKFKDLMNTDKILNKKEIMIQFKAFIEFVEQISGRIKDEDFYNFLKIFYSSLLDFSMFKDKKDFLNYFIKCYYASCFERNNSNDIFNHEKIFLLGNIFPLNENFFISKKKIFSKNLKSLMLIKEKTTSGVNKKNQKSADMQKLNFKEDPFFSLLIENVKKFDFQNEIFISEENNTDLSNVVNGLTFAQSKDNYIPSNYEDFYKNHVEKFFLDNLFFLSQEQNKLSKLQDNRWFKLFKQNQSVDLISKDDFIFKEKLMKDLNKEFIDDLSSYNEKFTLYENFLKDVSLAISVFFLKDWYQPYPRAMYYFDQNKKKTIFFGTLFGGLALLYKYQDKKLPQFLIQKSAEFIPFLKKYLPIFKQKFISGLSKLKR
jgi:hypothetical protein